MTDGDWHDVGQADGPPDGTLRRVEAGGRAVCLGRLGGSWIAFDDTCTHEACSLAGGELDGPVVVCPCHGSEFDVRTGDVLTPPALDPLPIYEVREEGGALLVRLASPPAADEATHARDDHVSAAVASQATVASPSLEGLSLDDVDLTDLDVWERAVPYDWLALLRRDAPVFWQPEEEGRGFWALTRYDDVVAVSKDWETFSNELGGTSLQDLTPEELEARKSMLDTDPPPHTRMRAIVNKGFTPRVINAYEERIRGLARGILERAFEEDEFDFVESVAAEIPMWVFSEIMGLPVDDRRLIIELGDKILGNTDPDVVGAEYVVERALRDPKLRMLPFSSPFSLDLIEYGRTLGEARRRQPREDITTRLVEAELDGSRLSEQEFGTFFILLDDRRERDDAAHDQPRPGRPSRAPGRAPAAGGRPRARGGGGRRAPQARTSGPPLPAHGDEGRRPARPADRAGRQGRDLVRGRELRRGEVRRPVPPRRRANTEPARHVRPRWAAFLPRRAPREARDQDLARGDGLLPPAPRAGRRAGAATLELLQRHQAAPGQGGRMTGRATTTPGSSMTDHDRDVEAELAALGTGFKAVRLLYPDLHGVARGKDIPRRHFAGMAEEGVTFCAAIMGTDLGHTPVVGGEEGYVDLAIRPDLDTLRLVPWQPEVAWCLGEARTLDGAAAWPVCARSLLRRVVEAYAERGLEPIVAPELEFFLVERDATVENGIRRYVDELSRVYTVGSVSDPRDVVLRMLLWCDELGLEAFAANHEFMNSQYEINVKHSGALDAADRAFMLKAAVKEIAVREGLLATFMGRPFSDQGGSGFHLHLSLCDGDGRNAFADEDGPGGLSRLAASFVAGVLEHAQGLQALLGPTVNAYKRILPDSLAPTHANWGHDNRTAFCRVPRERGARSRVEIRTGDGSANAHLIVAGVLLAGLDGIERELEPPEPVVGDSYRMDDAHAGSRLPADLGAALDALESDTALVEKLGPQLVSTFVAMKRFEVERFTEAAGGLDVETVTPWEVQEYAAHL